MFQFKWYKTKKAAYRFYEKVKREGKDPRLYRQDKQYLISWKKEKG